jgi:nucleoside-diphosphate-sugar epimerase
MKVMITGAAGSIGMALTKYCSEAGCQGLGFDIREPSLDWTGNAFELCDVRNATRLTEVLSRFRPERAR